MDINRAPSTSGGGFSLNSVNTNTMMTILIGLVIIILIILLFQSSSQPGGSGSSPATAAYMNPLNATMRTNPFVNTPQRNML
ncbi:ODV-E18 [Spodoptera frugiperda multiple nucleopolyhedrovirus]|uniref:ODV-E18 n=1 Tax=Spodoptera frugiperda nuclear polyhedrosis virus TaxID=10455 RepID=A1YJD0_NPVSF|nr:ODV-E18 [Spodoptera frugiperda multiple nucleopolyhedrovirus]ABM45850.1 ODV-E18 [Spodoptera frugiperda multiple nucleopolyhedrovirus]ACA02696.1 ODV-E18 [Spodoptera frugiperda multiple nucleopolyhedrovirus]ADV91372.1 odv-e18 [Spodoptera frugiperda multiple nucleopolyhedrovirus]AFH59083.1 odv-e18 [Spodoptera frugiperda multiple nucleopolyhedrovirus]AIW01551.1 occlusion derived virus E18 protein [Spodoptera frugiperda multiple nucleopolyhedrovirus]